MRTIIVGDVHGCYEELCELLELVNLVQGTDKLVFLGDLIDRGPFPEKVVKLARKIEARLVMGNHEEKFLRWYNYEAIRRLGGKKNPMKPHEDRIKEWEKFEMLDISYMMAAEPFIRMRAKGIDWLLTHGGVPFDKPLIDQDRKKLCRTRYLDVTTGAYAGDSDPRKTPDGAAFWTKVYKGPESVIYGHIVFKEGTNVEEVAPGVICAGIDTGCCFGGDLTAVIFEDGEQKKEPFATVSVPAKKEYFPRMQDVES